MRKSLFVLLLLQAAAFAVGAAEKRIYAHYMGCNPAWGGATRWHYYETHNYLKNTNDYVSAMGGNFHNWPLVPYPVERDNVEEIVNAKVEISRAKRYGFDGFAFDAWAGGDDAKQRFVAFCKAVEELKVDFGLTVCFDPSCLPVAQGKTMLDTYVETAQFVLENAKGRAAATFEGKPLFFGYYSNGIDPATNQGSLEERFAAEKKAWDAFRSRLGRPVFIHGSLDNYNGDWTQIGTLAAKVYDAAGGFLGGGEGSMGGKTTADALQAAGKVWSQPLSFQYANTHGIIIAWNGIDLMRFNWKAAMENKSRLIQFVTWNDYGEESCLAPTTGHGYSPLRVNKYYIDLWKNDGVEPPVEKDEVHVFYRRAAYNPDSFPFYSRRQTFGEYTQIITFLKAESTVEVKGHKPYVAPAGMHIEYVPPKPGPVAIRVRRGNPAKTVCGFLAPEEISDIRWREDPTIVGYGTGYEEEWKKDFPKCKPEFYSENGDIDKDGLPNWFEMVYFGKFPQMHTATAANPKGDPDHDGYTNLEEYRNQTDPTVADEPYPKGFTWSSQFAAKKQLTWNPARDERNRNVWYAFNDRGPNGQGGVKYDGSWGICPLIMSAAMWRRFVDSTWSTEINFDQATGAVNMRGNGNNAMLYGWKAPCSGEFAPRIQFTAGGGGGKLHVLVVETSAAATNRIADVALDGGAKGEFQPKKPLKLKKGDMLVVCPDYRESQGIGSLTIDNLEVRLVKNDERARMRPRKK